MTTLLPPQPATPQRAPALPGDPARDRLRDVLDARVPGRPLPGEAYTDPELHDVDLRLLWHRQWVFAGSVAEIPEPGDYVTVDLGPVSVIVLRDDDEQVRALRNVCRHRGARLVSGRGSVGNLVCGYHRWTYGTDGRLLHAPSLDPQQDTSCLGLRQVAVVEMGGLVFVNLAARPGDPCRPGAGRGRGRRGHGGAVPRRPPARPHQGRGTGRPGRAGQLEAGDGEQPRVLPLRRRPPRAHAHVLRDLGPHRRAGAAAAAGLPRADAGRGGGPGAALRRAPAARGPGGGPGRPAAGSPDRAGGARRGGGVLQPRRVAAGPEAAGRLDDPRLGRVTMHAQPNMWAHVLADHAVTFAVFPVAVDRTLVRTTWLVHADAVEGVDYDLDALTHVWRETNVQDAALVESTQRGVADPAYEPRGAPKRRATSTSSSRGTSPGCARSCADDLRAPRVG